MIAAGITRVVGPTVPDILQERWGAIIEKTKEVFREAGVEVKEIEYVSR